MLFFLDNSRLKKIFFIELSKSKDENLFNFKFSEYFLLILNHFLLKIFISKLFIDSLFKVFFFKLLKMNK